MTRTFRGADDGIRTRDPHLGKVVLYQLSHVRERYSDILPRSAGCRNPPSLPAGGPEAVLPAGGVVEVADLLDTDGFDALDDELGDAVAARKMDGLGGVEVDEDDLDLSAVAGVDRAGRVDQRHAVPCGQPRARVHQADAPRRDRDCNSGRDHSPLPRRERHILAGAQVEAGVTGVGVGRERQPQVETANP
jgi:hypothetical protein